MSQSLDLTVQVHDESLALFAHLFLCGQSSFFGLLDDVLVRIEKRLAQLSKRLNLVLNKELKAYL